MINKKKHRCIHITVAYAILTILLLIFFFLHKGDFQLKLLFKAKSIINLIIVIIITPLLYVVAIRFAALPIMILSSTFSPVALLTLIVNGKNLFAIIFAITFILPFLLYYFIRLKKEMRSSTYLIEKGNALVQKNFTFLFCCYILATTCYSIYITVMIQFIYYLRFEEKITPTFMFIPLLFSCIHIYWTHYILINICTFSMSTCYITYLINSTDKQEVKTIKIALDNTIKNMLGINRFAIWIYIHYKTVFLFYKTANQPFIYILNTVFGFTREVYRNRNGWKICIMSMFNHCYCKKIVEHRFAHLDCLNYNVPLYYIINFRNFMFSVILAISLLVNWKSEGFLVDDDGMVKAAILATIIFFSNSLICYVLDTAWRCLIIFYCVFGAVKLELYDKILEEKLRKSFISKIFTYR